jgi:hypothetical protein
MVRKSTLDIARAKMRETNFKDRFGQAIVHDSVIIAKEIQEKHSDDAQQDSDNTNSKEYYTDTGDVN